MTLASVEQPSWLGYYIALAPGVDPETAGYADVAQLTTLLSKAPAPVATAAPMLDVQNGPAKSDVAADLAALFPEIAAKLDR